LPRQDDASKPSKDHKSASLSKLEAQKIQALLNNDTKTAVLIQRIISLINKK
jgi:hypothetical protein